MLKQSEEYQTHFFVFFQGIIHHHLPSVGVEIDPNYEPWTELPPHLPPDDLDDLELLSAANTMWKLDFEMQHKRIGE